MPYSARHKQQTRQRILDSARRRFNTKGFAEVSIGGIMQHAGLTHGGFYRHFKDKDELYAVRWFLCEVAPKPWQRSRTCAARKSRARRIVDAYSRSMDSGCQTPRGCLLDNGKRHVGIKRETLDADIFQPHYLVDRYCLSRKNLGI